MRQQLGMVTENHMYHKLREPGAARAGGYVLALAGVLVAIGLIFHPLPQGGFDEQPGILSDTPWWGAVHAAIAFGCVLCILAGLLMLTAGARSRDGGPVRCPGELLRWA
jgi:multisubunit Na+/H+ antiporter MnhB subunit